MPSDPYSTSEICDCEVLETLLKYIPSSIQRDVRQLMYQAIELFNKERHVEILEVMNRVLSMCQNIVSFVPHVIAGKAIREAYNAEKVDPTPTFLSIELFMRFVSRCPFYRTALSRVEACTRIQATIEDNEGWASVKKCDNNCGTYYRFEASSKKHFFKVIDDLNVCAIYVCCVLLEMDLFSEWLPRGCCLHSQGEVSRFHKALFFAVKEFWPFTGRDLFVEGYGIDDLKHNKRIWIITQSLDETRGELPAGIRPPPCVKDSLRCDTYEGGFRIDVISPTTTRLSFIMSIDPKISFVPQKVINWASRKIIWKMIEEISKAATIAQDRQSKYFSRRRERPDLYNILREHFNEVIKEMEPLKHKDYILPKDY